MAGPQFVYYMKELSKTYPGGKQVLKDITLSFLPGAKIGVVGPNGAGKSTLLRALAGLVGVHDSRVEVHGVTWHDGDVSRVPTHRRRIGLMSQDPLLFPHLDVRSNIAFGLRMRGTGRAEALASADGWLTRMGLEGYGRRRTSALSGGQRQRVALARSLATDPDLLLLDEPFSALDAPVRDALRRRLRTLQREAGLNTVIVTHDPEEAALLADELLVIDAGRLLQAGPRRAVFDAPASPEVAALLGILNSQRGVVTAPGRIRCRGVELAGPTGELPAGAAVGWCVPPERLRVHPGGEHPATVVDDADLGATHELTLRLADGFELLARAPHGDFEAAATACRVELPPAAISVWPEAAVPPAAPLPDAPRQPVEAGLSSPS